MNGLNMVAFAAWFVNVAAICNRLGGKVAAQVIKAHHVVKDLQVLPLAARDNLVVAVEGEGPCTKHE